MTSSEDVQSGFIHFFLSLSILAGTLVVFSYFKYRELRSRVSKCIAMHAGFCALQGFSGITNLAAASDFGCSVQGTLFNFALFCEIFATCGLCIELLRAYYPSAPFLKEIGRKLVPYILGCGFIFTLPLIVSDISVHIQNADTAPNRYPSGIYEIAYQHPYWCMIAENQQTLLWITLYFLFIFASAFALTTWYLVHKAEKKQAKKRNSDAAFGDVPLGESLLTSRRRMLNESLLTSREMNGDDVPVPPALMPPSSSIPLTARGISISSSTNGLLPISTPRFLTPRGGMTTSEQNRQSEQKRSYFLRPLLGEVTLRILTLVTSLYWNYSTNEDSNSWHSIHLLSLIALNSYSIVDFLAWGQAERVCAPSGPREALKEAAGRAALREFADLQMCAENVDFFVEAAAWKDAARDVEAERMAAISDEHFSDSEASEKLKMQRRKSSRMKMIEDTEEELAAIALDMYQRWISPESEFQSSDFIKLNLSAGCAKELKGFWLSYERAKQEISDRQRLDSLTPQKSSFHAPPSMAFVHVPSSLFDRSLTEVETNLDDIWGRFSFNSQQWNQMMARLSQETTRQGTPLAVRMLRDLKSSFRKLIGRGSTKQS